MHLHYAFEQGGAVLTLVFLLLGGMSLLSWYLIFWKGWNLRKERKALLRFKQQYVTAPDWPRHEVVRTATGSVNLLLAETAKLKQALTAYEPQERRDVLAMHSIQALDIARVRIDAGLTTLASIGSSAPFVGLFGTVWGIYGALTRIAAEGNAGLSVVAGPMGEALVATAIGLFAAIPAVLAYNGFTRLNRLLVQDLRHVAEQLTLYLSLPASVHSPSEVRLVKDRL